MLVPVWSAKAGVGCTTLSLALAARVARLDGRCLLIDLDGDLPAAAGIAEPMVGVTDWLASSSGSPEALERLATRVSDVGVELVGIGSSHKWERSRADDLIDALSSTQTFVVVDVGCVDSVRTPIEPIRRKLAALPTSVFVTRACYLALHRAVQLDLSIGRVALIRENGRSLDRLDVSRLLAASEVVDVDVHPVVARAIDSGSMVRRVPRLLNRQLADLVAP